MCIPPFKKFASSRQHGKMKKTNLTKRKPQKARTRPGRQGDKASQFPLLSSEFLQGREDDAENLMALERMLLWTQGFTLVFARVNVPAQRAELVKEIRKRVEPKGVMIVEIDLQAPVRDLEAELVARLKKMYLFKPGEKKPLLAVADSAPRFAVFVYGLEHSLPSSEIYHPTLAVMNYKRENFREQIPASLVLWVPEYALQAIMEGAPDFWAWRSGLFEFAAPQQAIERTWQAVEPERGPIELSRMTGEEKRKRIQLLAGLLAEYEAQENLDAPEIGAIRLDLSNRIGLLYHFLGEHEQALEYYDRAHKLAQKSDNKAGLAGSLHNLGMIHQARGDYAAALAEYEKSLQLKEEIGDRAGIAASLHQIGTIHQAHGNYELALAGYEKSLKISEELGDRAGIAHSLHQIGTLHQFRGDYESALSKYEKAKTIYEEIADLANVAKSLHQIGNIHYFRGEFTAALSMYEKSLKIAEDIGDRAGAALTRGQIGVLFTRIGQYRKSFAHLLFAYDLFVELQSPNAELAVNMLKTLRTKWGAENFAAT
jgi:tetratricopeptide (TPR) repeat protein